MALAQDLPAAVLARLVGPHVTTTAAWSRELKRDWTAYLATRANIGERSGSRFVRDPRHVWRVTGSGAGEGEACAEPE